MRLDGASQPFRYLFVVMNAYGTVLTYHFLRHENRATLTPLLGSLKTRLSRLGVPDVDIVTIDNCCHMRAIWHDSFPELARKSIAPTSRFPPLTYPGVVTVITKPSHLSLLPMEWLDSENEKGLVFGFDIEWATDRHLTQAQMEQYARDDGDRKHNPRKVRPYIYSVLSFPRP